MRQFFTSGDQSIAVWISASASVLPMNIQDWFPLGLTGLISLQSKGLFKSLLQHHSSKAPILQHLAFFMVQLSHPYMTTGKTIALTRQTFVGKVISLLFNTLSRFVIAFLPRSKHLFISIKLIGITHNTTRPTMVDSPWLTFDLGGLSWPRVFTLSTGSPSRESIHSHVVIWGHQLRKELKTTEFEASLPEFKSQLHFLLSGESGTTWSIFLCLWSSCIKWGYVTSYCTGLLWGWTSYYMHSNKKNAWLRVSTKLVLAVGISCLQC